MPRLVRGIYRKPGKPAKVVAAILGGFFLSLGMILPNWFLGIGGDLTAYLLPGLLIGPSVGLALSLLPLEPSMDVGTEGVMNRMRRFFSRLKPYAKQMLAIALIGFLSFAVVRIPEATSIGTIEPKLYEVIFWGFGGAILGIALAVSWLAWPLSRFGSFLESEKGVK
jgi:hypothetical protein